VNLILDEVVFCRVKIIIKYEAFNLICSKSIYSTVS
jgi:hypothetical protein